MSQNYQAIGDNLYDLKCIKPRLPFSWLAYSVSSDKAFCHSCQQLKLNLINFVSKFLKTHFF